MQIIIIVLVQYLYNRMLVTLKLPKGHSDGKTLEFFFVCFFTYLENILQSNKKCVFLLQNVVFSSTMFAFASIAPYCEQTQKFVRKSEGFTSKRKFYLGNLKLFALRKKEH